MLGAKEVLLAEPRGFCAGVDRAIEIVERALTKFGAPIYVRHEIVHNTFVVNDLKAKGAIFIEELDDVPPGATLIFSAHGVSKAVQQEAERRGFESRRSYFMSCSLFVPMLLHGFWDFCLSFQSWIMTIIFYVFVLVFFLRANATLTRASRTDEPI